MATSLIRSRAAITGQGPFLLERNQGRRRPAGRRRDRRRRHLSTICTASIPHVPVIGTGKEILLPGFVNGHHHVGLTPVQLGSPDMPLELWFITRMVIRNLDLYLDTLYSAFEMIGSGITTVQHIHGWMPGTADEVAEARRRRHPRLRGYRHARQLLLRACATRTGWSTRPTRNSWPACRRSCRGR